MIFNQGLIFAKTVNGSPSSGMDMTNKLREGFAEIVDSRASNQVYIMDVPDWRLIGSWHPSFTNRWVYTIIVDQEWIPIADLGLLIF